MSSVMASAVNAVMWGVVAALWHKSTDPYWWAPALLSVVFLGQLYLDALYLKSQSSEESPKGGKK